MNFMQRWELRRAIQADLVDMIREDQSVTQNDRAAVLAKKYGLTLTDILAIFEQLMPFIQMLIALFSKTKDAGSPVVTKSWQVNVTLPQSAGTARATREASPIDDLLAAIDAMRIFAESYKAALTGSEQAARDLAEATRINAEAAQNASDVKARLNEASQTVADDLARLN